MTKSTALKGTFLAAGLLLAGAAHAGLIANDGGAAGGTSVYTTNNNNDLGLPGGTSQTVLVGYQLEAELAGDLLYTYLGKEAGYTNSVNFGISANGCTFSTVTSVAGDTCSATTSGGLLQFAFTTIGGGTATSLYNGQDFSITSAMTFGLQRIDDYTWRILLDDSGGNPNDKDYDDLGLRVVFRPHAVPEPGTLALLGLGIAGLGMIRRRRRT